MSTSMQKSEEDSTMVRVIARWLIKTLLSMLIYGLGSGSHCDLFVLTIYRKMAPSTPANKAMLM